MLSEVKKPEIINTNENLAHKEYLPESDEPINNERLVILINGIYHSTGSHGPFCQELADILKCKISEVKPGHINQTSGPSTPKENIQRLSIEDYVASVMKYIAKGSQQDISIIGHSLGGNIAARCNQWLSEIVDQQEGDHSHYLSDSEIEALRSINLGKTVFVAPTPIDFGLGYFIEALKTMPHNGFFDYIRRQKDLNATALDPQFFDLLDNERLIARVKDCFFTKLPDNLELSKEQKNALFEQSKEEAKRMVGEGYLATEESAKAINGTIFGTKIDLVTLKSMSKLDENERRFMIIAGKGDIYFHTPRLKRNAEEIDAQYLECNLPHNILMLKEPTEDQLNQPAQVIARFLEGING